jgi:hypothetical protein
MNSTRIFLARVYICFSPVEALFHLADGWVAHHLGELRHVTGLDLLPVVLEAPIPVFGISETSSVRTSVTF